MFFRIKKTKYGKETKSGLKEKKVAQISEFIRKKNKYIKIIIFYLKVIGNDQKNLN